MGSAQGVLEHPDNKDLYDEFSRNILDKDISKLINNVIFTDFSKTFYKPYTDPNVLAEMKKRYEMVSKKN